MPPINCTSKCRMLRGAAAGFADHGERLDQQVVHGLAAGNPFPEFDGLGGQFGVGKLLNVGFKRVDAGDDGAHRLDLALVLGPEDFREDSVKHKRGLYLYFSAPALIVALEDAADGSKGIVLVAAGGSGSHFAPHLFERHALYDDAAGPLQRCQKQAFPAEDRGLDAARELDVVVDRLIESDDAAGIHLDDLAHAQRELDEIAARVDERGARPRQLLQNEAFPAEKTRCRCA